MHVPWGGRYTRLEPMTSVCLGDADVADVASVADSVESVSIEQKGGEDEVELLLRPSESRPTIFPIRYPKLWAMYEKHEAVFWKASEIKFADDMQDWQNMAPGERFFIKRTLAFFGMADGVINTNLVENFCDEITIPEAQFFYGFQRMDENIHAHTYSLMIHNYVSDEKERAMLFNAITEIPCIARKAAWMRKWMDPKTASFAHRLVAFAVVEGVFFYGSFASIFWLKKRGLMPGLCFANRLIARDEGLHRDFACLLYTTLVSKRLSNAECHAIVAESISIACEFVTDAIPVRLIGINAESMCQYIKFSADQLLVELQHDKLYNVVNPFPWMDDIAITGVSNFFEKQSGEYSRAAATTTASSPTPTLLAPSGSERSTSLISLASSGGGYGSGDF